MEEQWIFKMVEDLLNDNVRLQEENARLKRGICCALISAVGALALAGISIFLR